MTSTITVLILAQAFINIGYVIGLLPVTGIQLPLISAGGASTLTVLAMLGLLANAARHEPEAVAALTAAPSRVARWLRLPAPVAYRQSRVEMARERLDRRRKAAGQARGTSFRRSPDPRVDAGPRAATDVWTVAAREAARRPSAAAPLPARRAAGEAAHGRFSMPWKRGEKQDVTGAKAPDPAYGRRASTRHPGVGGRTRPALTARTGVDYRGGYPPPAPCVARRPRDGGRARTSRVRRGPPIPARQVVPRPRGTPLTKAGQTCTVAGDGVTTPVSSAAGQSDKTGTPNVRGLSVVVAGGGTAGHIEPALAVADAIRRLDPTARVTALGTRRGLEVDLVPERGYDLRLIPPVPLPASPGSSSRRRRAGWCPRSRRRARSSPTSTPTS